MFAFTQGAGIPCSFLLAEKKVIAVLIIRLFYNPSDYTCLAPGNLSPPKGIISRLYVADCEI